ncbi:WYL domain-containing protein [Lederbergia wuyishanensis]|uniref:DNA-binding transcriptional regulator YafY n=1 Tax=Lederbergia wuyishanensis TaxID=1347903 RepID=A0ABU0D938_9BACI|nr:WYL domain-containing protein [Lederbergia wuyishanensis]MCJ8009475.1 WYL domain-containing protein [Lederbergia wuyishanensis]MDQ0344915.1 putative DNA-binding transcriptional regulator YafY [Lederbergia wuyishanensis]
MKRLLAESLRSGIKLEMIYLSDKKVVTQRTIKVLAIGESTFKAFCYLRREERLFKLENILSITVPRKKYFRGA